MNENYYAVIMAGGVGSRFWPVSTPDHPKQFHDMLGTGRSLLQQTYDRLSRLIPEKNILVATNERYKALVSEHLPLIEEGQMLLEPVMRNTAPCILYSALKIRQENPDAVMIVAPSDHFIENEEEFLKNVHSAFEACQRRNILMTLGIRPSGPNTGYGYIQYEPGEEEVKKIRDFTEKPDLETAKAFLRQGDYLWNAGIFIWSVKSILEAFENSLKDMYELFCEGNSCWNTEMEMGFIQENYGLAENISIDFGIMEKAPNVCVMATDFGWNDLGTWGSLYEKLDKDGSGNASVNALALFRDARGNMVRTQKGKRLVVQGLDDFIIVETPDTILIFPKDKEQDIKSVSKEAQDRFDAV